MLKKERTLLREFPRNSSRRGVWGKAGRARWERPFHKYMSNFEFNYNLQENLSHMSHQQSLVNYFRMLRITAAISSALEAPDSPLLTLSLPLYS